VEELVSEIIAGTCQGAQAPLCAGRVIMLLPKDRVEALVAEELRFAESMNNAGHQIHTTWFDFRRRGAASVPVAVRQN
jgi:hypothetical protein